LAANVITSVIKISVTNYFLLTVYNPLAVPIRNDFSFMSPSGNSVSGGHHINMTGSMKMRVHNN
jgi:hypothetical protein